MKRPYRRIKVENHGDVCCVHIRQPQLDENELYELGDELVRLIDEDGCRKMVLNLGPTDPEFLYSVFLAKLVSLQKRLRVHGGSLKLAHASANTHRIFEVCGLVPLFEFVPDQATGVAAFAH